MAKLTKLAIAKQLRVEHGTITCYDHSISFRGDHFREHWFTCEGDLRSETLTWQDVLKEIKTGRYS